MGREILVIKLSQSYYNGMTADELYLATSRSWKLSMQRLAHVSTVLAVAENEVKEVYCVDEWIESSDEGRKEFIGKVAEEHLRKRWKGVDATELAAKYSPIRYIPE
jgi:hypothetical protein